MWTVIVATVLGWFSAVQAQLVVSKEYSDPHLVAGMSRTITYHLFNLGKDSVTNINLEDATFKRNFTIDQGTLPLQLAELKPYPLLQTIASCRNERYAHQVMVTPTTIGRHPDLPAFIKYQRPKVATTSEGVGSTEELEWAVCNP